jgi:cephalosporin hydroxylase
MSDEATRFADERRREAAEMHEDGELKRLSREWFDKSYKYRYSYNFRWLGRPIIQYPEDIVAIQELLWRVQPDLVIETGVAHGGSLILSSSVLELIGHGSVIGVDIDIRAHNRKAIEAHPLSKRIHLIEGSSIDDKVLAEVSKRAAGQRKIVVFLDSNHTHEHVLRELDLYSPFVGKDSYLVAFDTVVEEMPETAFGDRPWGRGNNPMTAVREFLARNRRFVIDEELDQRLQFSVAPRGYLRCVEDA